MNNYYKKKKDIQNELKPKLLQKFREGMKSLNDSDWLFLVPTALDALTEDFSSKKDSFRFPDSILLFEAWMSLGFDALFPQYVLHFKYPGILKGEKYRHLFQFIFSTSRGFGFPIMFSPQFYNYDSRIQHYLDPFLKWVYTVCHKSNQAISLVGNKFNIIRHHPGEFESIIISEFTDKSFYVFDTLLHGFYSNKPKKIGRFSSLKEVLAHVIFSYSIGDHAMSIDNKIDMKSLMNVRLIPSEEIKEEYDVDFFSYVLELLQLSKMIQEQLTGLKKKRSMDLKTLSLLEKIKFWTSKSLNRFKKVPYLRANYPSIYSSLIHDDHSIHLMNGLKEILFDTPLYTHTVHEPKKNEKIFRYLISDDKNQQFIDKHSRNSILLAYISYYEKKFEFQFNNAPILQQIKKLRDDMAKIWLYFRERQFNYAVRKISEFSTLAIDNKNYNHKVREFLDILIPIISIYEMFHRSLAESVYPESVPQVKRLGAFIARFFAYKYNPIGITLMKLFNKLAFNNWSYFIIKNRLSLRQFLKKILKLPIWKDVPLKVKNRALIN